MVSFGCYEGEFNNDKREGKGTMSFDDGNIYIGDWLNDMANGKGKFISKNKYEYEGDWVNNEINTAGLFQAVVDVGLDARGEDHLD